MFGFIDIDKGSRLTDLAANGGLHQAGGGRGGGGARAARLRERVPDPLDGRAKIIKLTDHGRDAADQGAPAIFAEIEREWAEESAS